MNSANIEISNIDLKKRLNLKMQGKTVMFLVSGKTRILAGAVALSDTVRETSVQAVNRLSRMDIDVCMLTGDNDATAAAIAKSVGIKKKVFANVLPQ